MSYDAIDRHGGIQWPYPAGATDAAETRRLYTDGRFQTEDGKARLIAVGVGAVSRAADAEFPARAEHRPHGRALAHAHEDRRGADSRAAVAEPVGRDEPARRPGAAAEGVGSRGRRVAARTYSQPGAAAHRDGRARSGVRAVSLGDVQREPGDAERFDPISREPNYKQSAVRVERAL